MVQTSESLTVRVNEALNEAFLSIQVGSGFVNARRSIANLFKVKNDPSICKPKETVNQACHRTDYNFSDLNL